MAFDKIKAQAISIKGGIDYFGDSESWDIIEKKIPEEYWNFLIDRSGATFILDNLPDIFPTETIGLDKEAQTCWARIGNYFKNQRRFHEAIPIYNALYEQLIESQKIIRKHIHKGIPLVWMSDCFEQMGFQTYRKRYMMLNLCENAILYKGKIDPDASGTYFRLVWRIGLTDESLNDYAKKIYDLSKNNPEYSLYSEWLLQQLDKNWMTEIPSPAEAGHYWTTDIYIQELMSKLPDKKGKILEALAEYILSCMPGCRTKIRKTTISSEIDIICSIDGLEADFRSELGRYFICECKDLKRPVNFSDTAKFCRVLDSVKSRFGIIFSPKGISGQKNRRYSGNEQQKLFQSRGIVLIVIDEEDFKFVASGGNFINLLRDKYEKVRLDLVN